MKLLPEIIELKDYCVELRRYFHLNPELSLKEFNTSKKIIEELEKLNIEYIKVGETGVCGFIKGEKPGKTIVLRADIDALPINELNECDYKSKIENVMHACGHDGHTASLLLTAAILKNLKFDGEIRLFFQQAEEIGQGARQFIKAGLLENVDEIIAYHGWSDYPIGTVSSTKGPVMASCDYFKIEIEGKSAHVSTPQQGIDALYIASRIVCDIQSIVARNIDPLDSVIIGIGKLNSGTAYNVVSPYSSIEGTTRAFSKATREKIKQMIIDIANNDSKPYGAKCSVTFKEYADPLINDDEVTDKLAKIAGKYADNVVNNSPKRLGADDFADYLNIIKGTYMFVGTKNDTNMSTHSPHHNEYFDIDEQSMLLASSILVDYTREFFK